MSVTHRSLSVAVESSFGSLSATTNLPDNSGLTYTSIPCERDPILIYGEVVASERNDARDGSYFIPPEPDTEPGHKGQIGRITHIQYVAQHLLLSSGNQACSVTQ